MSVEIEIGKAINWHKQMKLNLRNYIRTAAKGGALENAEVIIGDKPCEFASWLKEGIDEELKSTDTYQTVLELDKKLHEEAAIIVETIEMQNYDEANELMRINQPFTQSLTRMINYLINWRNSLEQDAAA